MLETRRRIANLVCFRTLLSWAMYKVQNQLQAECGAYNLRERGGVLKTTLVVDNDTTVHDVHSCLESVSPDQV